MLMLKIRHSPNDDNKHFLDKVVSIRLSDAGALDPSGHERRINGVELFPVFVRRGLDQSAQPSE